MVKNSERKPGRDGWMGFRPRRITHVNFFTGRADESFAFYRDIVGIEIAYERPHLAGKFYSNGNTYHDLALIDGNGPVGDGFTGFHHIGFEAETEAEMIDDYHSAVASGVHFTEFMSSDAAHSLYLADPDGNGVEIYADVVGEWREVASGVVHGKKPKWFPGATPPITEPCYPRDPVISKVDGAALHPRRMGGAALVMEKYEEAVDFYCDVIGLRPLIGGKDDPYTVLGGKLGEPDLSLFRGGLGTKPGPHHVSFEIADEREFDEARRRLTGRGITVEVEIDHPLRRCLYITDPDGFLLQFYVRKDAVAGGPAPTPEVALLLF